MAVKTAPSSGRVYTDSLVAGPVWDGLSITYSFPTAAAQFTGYAAGSEPFINFEALNAVQQAAVRAILAQISSFTNLTFTQHTGASASTATLRFGMSDGVDEGALAHAYLPSTSPLGGDSWYANTGGYNDNPVRGNDPWHTFLHEIGHTLGLGHPHEPDGDEPAMPVDRDFMVYTVMSYNSDFRSDGYRNEEWSWAQTYMMEDIAALQLLYGANFNYNSSNNVYSWNPLTAEMSINGVGQGAPGANRIFMTVWDGGGSDTYDFSNYILPYLDDGNPYNDGVRIDLGPGGEVWLPLQNADLGYGPRAANVFQPLLYNGDIRSLIENAIGTNGNDRIIGNVVANTLTGGDGMDEIDGGGGNDRLWGGPDGDVLHGGDDDDLLYGEADWDTLHGGAGNDVLDGGDGNDRLEGHEGIDSLTGGEGDDYIDGHDGDDTLDGGAGNDVLGGGEGDNALVGGAGNDGLYGGEGQDTLNGGVGNDTLDGGTGNDVMTGGAGDDTYFFRDPGAEIIELSGQGIDTVRTVLSYTAAENIENVYLELSPITLNAVAIGNALNNRITGNFDANIIDGKAGTDIMGGGLGDDIFHVDNSNDVVIEFEGQGTDAVYSSVSYTLLSTPPPVPTSPGYDPYAGASLRDETPLPYAVEILVLTGNANLNASGSEIANTLLGNSGDNRLDGKEGNDELDGGLGADILNGGLGDDRLHGRSGADTASYAGLAAGVIVNLSLSGTQDTGVGGVDKLISIENLIGTSFDDALTGNTGVNVLDGGRGVDLLAGGLGNDTYIVDKRADAVGEAADAGIDTVRSTSSYALADNLENLVLEGTRNAVGTGNSLANQITGNSGANRLDGGIGADRLVGGVGDDTYVVDNAGDVLEELIGQGLDTVISSVDFALGDFFEDLVLIGNAAIDGIGNDEANTIIGNRAANVLEGGDRHDTIEGGSRNDTLLGGNGHDVLIGGGGADTLTGGSGADTFALAAAAHSRVGNEDTITDFRRSQGDRIDLGGIDAVAGGDDDAFSLVNTFSGTAGELVIRADGLDRYWVSGDIDGDGRADFEVAVLSVSTLGAGDFLL